MRCFPVPYPDELIYSLVARAGIRSAITSSKQLLDEVFGDRKVIATIDLPSHLSSISELLINTERFDVQQLIYEHTMFPIYAPFVDESIRIRAMQRMEHCAKGSVHLMLGAPASIVKASDNFRVCPACVAEQKQKYGESYWSRFWFLPSLPYCSEHGLLNKSTTSYHDNRHTYHECGRIQCQPFLCNDQNKTAQQFAYLASKAQQVMRLSAQSSPTQHQWSLFYNHLAHDFGCGKGTKQIAHDKIADLIVSKIVTPELTINSDSDTNWLSTIFRRHRKAFSYLQHLTVWSAFIPDMSTSEIIKEVKSKEKVTVSFSKDNIHLVPNSNEKKRKQWRDLIGKTSIKKARKLPGGGARYAWLYRNDRDWLLAFNRAHQSQLVVRQKKVDWRARDRSLTKQLLTIVERLDTVIDGPRRSKNFLLKQLGDYGSVSKKLNLLPLVSFTLNRYQESVFEFQARRLAMAVIAKSQTGVGMSRWQLMRSASLPKERILPIVDDLLGWIVTGSNIK
ncbi:Transposon Tn7 transposition protein TnsD [Vibrio crassostreae]|nr:TniQ protein [Vibrio crassostreae]CAK2428406.1 Transposon Tn7 transposition protein TnsD [Vibrio crassostreae]CAK2489685.1 Transposon Tn7 transposition protein TnsD [Vibrio crassostreae]CAK3671391.1 Transposon Tn7 transposition protein TnsD [Vibrio crassostreae]CAK3821662.1 Transposon Tn7 transposition protein TnsD [Vibrio crassostreae]